MGNSLDNIVIIGAGIAGLTAALRLAPRRVTVIANAPMGKGVASGWSQGGIAAALSSDDSPEAHQHDTLIAAAGIGDVNAIKIITEEGQAAIEFLTRIGVDFDKLPNGDYALSKEAAHGCARIVRVAGDLTGPGIMAALRKSVAATPSITIRSGFQVVDLAVEDNKVQGLWITGENGAVEYLPASAVILATGGIGYLYRNTSNPPTACGEGIAVAARAGASLADLEFVQFHPTTLAVGKDPSPLATEALRGEGAILINDDQERFMIGIHKDAELAPRDIVARAIFAQIQNGHKVYLDCSKAIGKDFAAHFPKVFALCQEVGIDPSISPIPVEPAAHYHMGGVATDALARTSIEGLWACGEVACSGAHGANRLASNSLLEAVVFAKRAAMDINTSSVRTVAASTKLSAPVFLPHNGAAQKYELQLRQIMRESVGVIRNKAGLEMGLDAIKTLQKTATGSTRLHNMILVAELAATFALWREESRGSHFRTDFPMAKKDWQRRQFYTLNQHHQLINQTPSKKSAAG
ncbi:MAG: L-aspartate oxidase [Alphaproteobacteria bacterium]|nr:MAG: L-aspartate oxidase [Alphaproteobacteria bacterium]